MAKGKKTGGRNFTKGQSGNPRGPARVPQDIKEARALDKADVERLIRKWLRMTKEEILSNLQNPKTEGIELLIGSIVSKGVVKGDERRLNFLLDRIIGKVTDRIGDPDGNALSGLVVMVPTNGREAE